jgi:hypothetical protein
MCKLAWSSWRSAAAGRKAHTCCNTSAGSEHRVREWSCGGAALTASLAHSVVDMLVVDIDIITVMIEEVMWVGE